MTGNSPDEWQSREERTPDAEEAATDIAKSALYSMARRMHESIAQGRGATGWHDGEVGEIIHEVVRAARIDRDERHWRGIVENYRLLLVAAEAQLRSGPCAYARLLEKRRHPADCKKAAEFVCLRCLKRLCLGHVLTHPRGPIDCQRLDAALQGEG